RKDPRQ
ncbi:hypothetical protein D027_0329B, partial [Vibrio parahaemolyticus 861]